MERTRAIVRAARRRIVLRDLLGRLGRFMTVGAAAGLALVLAERCLWWPFNSTAARPAVPGFDSPAWPILLGAPVLIAVASAAVATLVRTRTSLAAASEVDETLRLRDALSTALVLDERGTPESDAFAAVAVEDAERTAIGVDVGRAIPYQFGRGWKIWPVLAMLAIAGGVFLPAWRILSSSQAAAIQDAGAQQQRTAEALADAAKALVPPEPALDSVAPENQKQADALAEIQKELENGATDAETARREGTKTLEDAAESLESAAEQQRLADEALRQRLAALASQDSNAKSDPDSLAAALRSGDLAAARQAARTLLNRAPDLSAEEREQLARQFEKLARDLDNATKAPTDPRAADKDASGGTPNGAPADNATPAAPDAAETSLQNDLENQGLTEADAKEALQSPDAESAAKRLQDKGVDPEAARRLGEKIAENQRRREAQEKAGEKAKDLSDGLKNAADSLRGKDTDSPPDKPNGSGGKDGAKNSGDSKGAPKDTNGQKSNEQGSKDGQSDSGTRPTDTPETRPEGSDKPNSDESKTDGSKSGDANDGKQDPKNGDPSGSAGEKPSSDARNNGDKPGDDGQSSQPGEKSTEGGQKGDGDKPADNPGEKGDKPGDGDKPGIDGGKTGAPSDEGKGKETEGDKDGSKPDGTPGPKPGGKPTQGQKDNGQPAGGDKANGEPGDKEGRPEEKQAGEETGSPGGDKPPDDAGDKSKQGNGGKKPGGAGAKPGDNAGKGATDSDSNNDAKNGGAGGGKGDKPSQSGGGKADGDKSGDNDKPAGQSSGGAKSEGKPGGNNGSTDHGDQPGGGSGGHGSGLHDLARRIEDLADARRRADQDDARARDLREHARKLLESASPEERRQLEEWAGKLATENPNQGSQPRSPDVGSELVDARGDDSFDPSRARVVAEWMGKGNDKGGGRAEGETVLREAEKSAERAMENGTLPARYDKLLRRYFKRLPDRVLPKDAAAPADRKD